MQTGDVSAQMRDPAAVFGFRRGKNPAVGVVTEVAVGEQQVWVVFVGGDLGQVILEHAAGLPQGDQDSDLAVGVVVRHQGRSPQEDIIGAPSKGSVKFVLHYL